MSLMIRSIPATKLLPIVRLWLLRLLVPLNAQRRFIRIGGIQDDSLAIALGLGKWVDREGSEFDVRGVRADLREIYESVERRASTARPPRLLSQNIARLGKLVGLTDIDLRILEFAVMIQGERLLDDTADHLGSLSSTKVVQVLSVLLGLPHASVRQSLEGQGMLARSGLLTLDRSGSASLRAKLNLLSDRFADYVTSSSTDPIGFLRDKVLPSPAGHLSLADFSHVAESMQVLVPYLRKSVRTRRPGVNILMHGSPGTGKSQFAKALATEIGCGLYEVSGEDSDGDPVSGGVRLRAYRAAQGVLSRSKALIVFDEVEDVFDQAERDHGFGVSPAKGKKAWINRVLENNAVPALWLTNSISNIDRAFLRRFDMVIEFPVPPLEQRKQIAREACDGLLDAEGIARFAECDVLAPAVVGRAAAVVRFVGEALSSTQAGAALQRLVDQTLRAQGHAGLASGTPHALPATYDPEFIRADADLVEIARGIASAGSARMCLYGPPGTGKTAWVRWLAAQLDKPLVVKRASDLMSMWVGQTEKLIADAFRQAQAEGAILLVDEVDSFLQERRGAKHSWEVTQVNEMLTQMEGFGSIFIASTNLMDGLDEASLRRFDLKVKFDYLQPAQAKALLARQASVLGLSSPQPEQFHRISRLANLTPGDFAAIARQHRFRPMASTAMLLDALEREVALKRRGTAGPIGFA